MKRAIIGLACLAFGATACTPEEVAFWVEWHDSQPEEVAGPRDDDQAEEPPAAVVPAPTVVDTQTATSYAYEAGVTCGPPTLRLTNTDDETLYYAAYYGPSQTPLFSAVASDAYPNYGPPPLAPGETVTVVLTPSIGTTTWIALDQGWATGGVVAHVDVYDC